jgi:SAM-dependent methyltransferase
MSEIEQEKIDDDSVSPAFFVEMVVGYRKARVVLTAEKLGIFDALKNGALTPKQLAEGLKLDLRATRILLRALTSLGLCKLTEEDTFANTRLAARFLVPGSAQFVGNNLRFQDLIWPAWGELTDIVRTGSPRKTLIELLTGTSADFRESYIRGMHDIAKRPAQAVASALASTNAKRILDVGAGPGTFTYALLEALPNSSATLFDLPETLAIAKEYIARFAEPSRIETRAGNYLEDDYGQGFDLVLMSHITHDEGPDAILTMLKRAYLALKPGKSIAIHDFVVSNDGCGSEFSTMFSVNMLAYTKAGQTYSRSEYSGLLQQAGFVNVQCIEVLQNEVPNPTCLLVAQKPQLN